MSDRFHRVSDPVFLVTRPSTGPNLVGARVFGEKIETPIFKQIPIVEGVSKGLNERKLIGFS